MSARKPTQMVNPLEAEIDLERVSPRQAMALLAHVSDNSFLTYIFCVLLGRFPDRTGLIHYRQRLASGLGRQNIIIDLMLSDEFKDRVATLQSTVPYGIQSGAGEGAWQAKASGRASSARSSRTTSSRGGLPPAERREGERIGRISDIARFAFAGALVRPRLCYHCVRLLIRGGHWSPVMRWRLVISLFGGKGRAPQFPEGMVRVPVAALSPLTLSDESTEVQISPIDPATADRSQIDKWAFQIAYRDAHRRALVW